MLLSWISPETIATTASILVAIFFGVREARRSQRQQEQAHTLSLFAISFSDEVLQRAASLINDHAAALGTRPKVDSNEDLYFRALLSYYHFLSIAAANGTIDKRMLIVQKGSAIARAYSVLKDWISDQRLALKDPGYMKGLEAFVLGTIHPTIARESKRSDFSARFVVD